MTFYVVALKNLLKCRRERILIAIISTVTTALVCEWIHDLDHVIHCGGEGESLTNPAKVRVKTTWTNEGVIQIPQYLVIGVILNHIP